MRKAASVVLFCVILNNAYAVKNPDLKPSFADLSWYSTRDYVKRTLVSKGYKYTSDVGKFADSAFDGKLNGIPVIIIAEFNNKNQLVKTNIVFRGVTAKNTYDSIKQILTDKYGEGLSNEVSDLTNYDILLSSYIGGKKKHETVWLFPTSSYDIWLQITNPFNNDNSFATTLSYESPAWSAEFDRRNKNSDF